jgi:hypothetical protein
MFSNELCKKLSEESHKHATIPDSKRYGVHFEYHDLVKKLLKVKEEREEKKKSINLSIDTKKKTIKEHLTLNYTNSKRSTKDLYLINTERAYRNTSEKALPPFKSPKIKLTPKVSLPVKSDYKIRVIKSKSDAKLHPITKKSLRPLK